MEKVPTNGKTSEIENTQEYKDFEKRFHEIVRNLNWPLFFEIYNKHRIKSGLSAIKNKEIHKPENKKDFLRRIKDLIKYSFVRPVNLTEIPKFTINNRLKNTGEAYYRHNLVKVNLVRLLEKINNLKGFSRPKEDADLPYLITLMFLFHETTHLVGHIFNTNDLRKIDLINEAVTEFLSFTMLIEYLHTNGDGIKNIKLLKELFFIDNKTYYSNEKDTLLNILSVLALTEKQTLEIFLNSLYSSYFNKEFVLNDTFLKKLNPDLRTLIIRFLDSNLGDKDYNENAFGLSYQSYQLYKKVLEQQKNYHDNSEVELHMPSIWDGGEENIMQRKRLLDELLNNL